MNKPTFTKDPLSHWNPPSTSEHPADRHLTQLELKLQNATLGPLHLLYLMAIHQGDFDKRLHQGHFAKAEVFTQRIADLIDLGLVSYRGAHYITPRGTAYVDELLAVRLKP